MPRLFFSIILLLLVVAAPGYALEPPASLSTQNMCGFQLHVPQQAQFKAISDHCLSLSQGNLLLEATDTGLVVTPLSLTYMKRGSIVFFRINSGLERIMTLYDNSRSSVVTVAQKSAARLGAGDEVIVSDHQPFYREIHQSDIIGRRRVDRFFVGNSIYMTTSEFSIPEALKHSGLIYSHLPGDQLLTRKVLRTHLILSSLREKREPFAVPAPLDTSNFNPHDPISSYEDLLQPVLDHSLRPLPRFN